MAQFFISFISIIHFINTVINSGKFHCVLKRYLRKNQLDLLLSSTLNCESMVSISRTIGEKLPARLHWRMCFLVVVSSHDSLRRPDYSNAIYYIRSLPATCCEPRPSFHFKRFHNSESNLDLLYKQMLIYCWLIGSQSRNLLSLASNLTETRDQRWKRFCMRKKPRWFVKINRS